MRAIPGMNLTISPFGKPALGPQDIPAVEGEIANASVASFVPRVVQDSGPCSDVFIFDIQKPGDSNGDGELEGIQVFPSKTANNQAVPLAGNAMFDAVSGSGNFVLDVQEFARPAGDVGGEGLNLDPTFQPAGNALGESPVSLLFGSPTTVLSNVADAKPQGTPGGGKGSGSGDGGTSDPTPATSFWSSTFGSVDVGGTDHFNITVEFYGDQSTWGAIGDAAGGFTGGFIDAFIGAANFLTSIITVGYASSDYTGPYADVEAGLAGETRTADDLVIEAYLTDIDGVGGALGRAGAYDLPDSDGDDIYEGFPTAGLMEFDVSDAGDLLSGSKLGGLWNDTVLHEMMHVVGFGTLWDHPTEGGTVSGWDTLVGTAVYYDDNGTRSPRDDNHAYLYNGTIATAERGDNLWVEADGGSGTARGHWDEGVYDDEIMTGYINSLDDGVNAGANYMSDFTVAALSDLGYQLDKGADGFVDYDAMAAAGSYFLETGEVYEWSNFVT